MGKWITPQEVYEATAKEMEEQYRKDPENAWFRITVPWEQASQAVKDNCIKWAIRANKRLHEVEQQQQAALKKRPPMRKRKKWPQSLQLES